MLHIKGAWRNAVAIAAVVLSLSACGGEGSGSPPAPPADSASIAGRVADAQTGDALAGVTVQAGSLKTTSDADGKFSLSGVASGANVVVQFSKPEYAANFATVDVVTGQTSVADRRLARVAVRKELSAQAGGAVVLDGSAASVQLPAGGLVNAATGAAASGSVSVEMTPIDPSIHPLNMPGNYRAQGESMPIESMGALQVEIRDASGALLNLAPGTSATIRIPVPAAATSPPLTMPLYYFKESSGLWVREGSATLAGSPPNQYYEGQVSHFTTWNADRPAESIMVNGCVVNQAGQPVVATVMSSGIDYIGSAQGQMVMPGGKFQVAARRASRVQVAVASDGGEAGLEVATGTADLSLPECLVIRQQPPLIYVQPANATLAPGQYGMLQVVAGAGSQYQWYRNGQAMSLRTPYLVLVGDSNAPGDYHVVVSNAYGTVTSAHAQVGVGPATAPPVILGQPQPLGALRGSPASFTVQAQGDSLAYQWLRNGVEIPSANGPTLTFSSVESADSGAQFRCRVSNSAGSVLTDPVALTVTDAVVPAGIAQQPGDASVRAGQSASFAVVASGTGPFSYQWMLNGVAIPNATVATYQARPAVQEDNNALYSVRVSNAAGTVTSSQARLTVSTGTEISGLYLPFMAGQPVGDSYGWWAVPAGGGAPVSLLPGGQGTVVDEFLQAASVSNAGISNLYERAAVGWQNQRLYRQDLVAVGGLGPASQISALSGAGVCDDSDLVGLGNDMVDALKSWRVFRYSGLDGICRTPDDAFFAVRLDMAATDRPVAISLPLTAIRGANGTLTGWLLRDGQQILRAKADFSSPVQDFNLPASDLAVESSGTDLVLLASGGKLYAVNTSRPAPSVPALVTNLGDSETLETVLDIDAQNAVIVLSTPNATRFIRYSSTSMAGAELGTVPGSFFPGRIFLTPTRIVMGDNFGKLMAMPLGGGSAQVIYSPAISQLQTHILSRGERVWQQIADTVVSVNSDGSGAQTLPASQLAGCIYRQAMMSSDNGCDAVVIWQDSMTLRAYDAATGAPRLTYGAIPAPSTPFVGMLQVGLSAWGQGAVVTQFTFNPSLGLAGPAVSYFIRTDQAGVTLLNVP